MCLIHRKCAVEAVAKCLVRTAAAMITLIRPAYCICDQSVSRSVDRQSITAAHYSCRRIG